MIRLILYFLLIAAAALGLSWVADRPGSLTVEWLGYDVKTSVFIAAIILVLAFALLASAIWLGVLTWTAPKRLSRRLESRRRRIGQEAVRRGIFAAGAGDKAAALRAGAIAKKHVPDEPLALLLEAQSAQLNEDAIGSRQAFERMLEKPEMAELGLRGLFIEAKKTGQGEAAKQFAERALEANPSLSWPSSALFEIQCREGDWRGALKTLGIAKQHKHLSRPEAGRRRALLLTQLAIELEETQQGKALAYAQEAIGLAPSLTPATAVAGRILASQGNSSRAAKVLAQAWRNEQHPEIALLYAHARTGDSPRDRLNRVKALVSSGPSNLEGDIAVAVAAIEAKDWAAARLALEPHLSNIPPARVCRLMARIEAGQNRDSGRAREWLAKAGRGAPDPLWVAPDGTVSAEWQAITPSGALGAFEWKTPSVPGMQNANEIIAEMSALDLAAIDAETVSPPATTNETSGASSELVVSPSAPAKGTPSEGEAVPVSGMEPGLTLNGHDRKDEEAGEGSVAKRSASREVIRSLSDASAPGSAQRELRKPAIFVPNRAPDDPGPRGSDPDDHSTPLSRFRAPS